MNSNQNTKANNKLIAQFMGLPYKTMSMGEFFNRKNIDNTGTWYNVKALKYDTSWDWLMPVVEKIINHKYEDGDTAYPRTFGMPFTDGLSDSETTYMVRFNRQLVFHGKTLIEATYDAVISFITTFNNQILPNVEEQQEADLKNISEKGYSDNR